jgi:hypothetical protein
MQEEKTVVKVCPYCKGQSPTCIECDFGGYAEGPAYKRMHTSESKKPVEMPKATTILSLEAKLLQGKIKRDYERLMEIYHNHISLANDHGLHAARKFWTIQLYKGNDYALQVDILEFLEVFRSVLHRQKVKKGLNIAGFAKSRKSKKNKSRFYSKFY